MAFSEGFRSYKYSPREWDKNPESAGSREALSAGDDGVGGQTLMLSSMLFGPVMLWVCIDEGHRWH